MTVRAILKLVEPEHLIEIVDVDDLLNENSIFDGQKKDLKKLSKESYLEILNWHVEEVAAFSSVLVLFVVTPKTKTKTATIKEWEELEEC